MQIALPNTWRGRGEAVGAAVLVALVAYSLFAFPWLERVECLRTGPFELKVLTIAWDAAILTAYAWIPVSLVLVWLGLEIRPGGLLLVLYGLFVILCGLTHGMTIFNFSHPLYWLAMKLKAVTGAVSLAVAYVTETRKPDLLALGRQGAALRAKTAEAEERALQLQAAHTRLEESARSAEAARRQAEGLASDLAKALEEKSREIAKNAQLVVELNLAKDQANQRAMRAEGTIDSAVAARDDAQRNAEELQRVNEELERLIEHGKAASQRIEAQALAIRELETPVTPIWQDVLLCPMVGPMDSQRAKRLMENLLAAVCRFSSRIVILDLTGVKVVDTEVASALSQTAQAVGLVGAKCIITGIGADVAVTMIGIGVTSLGIETRRDVQQGLRLATQLLKGV